MRDLGIPYQQVRGMTVWELNRRAEGFNRRLEREWLQVGTIASAVLNPHMKKGRRVKPKDFVPKLRGSDEMSEEEKQQDIKRKTEAMNRHLKKIHSD